MPARAQALGHGDAGKQMAARAATSDDNAEFHAKRPPNPRTALISSPK